MTYLEQAARIPVPVGVFGRHRAVCEVRGGRYVVAFSDGIRAGAAVADFDRPRKAADFAALINNGIPTPRSGDGSSDYPPSLERRPSPGQVAGARGTAPAT